MPNIKSAKKELRKGKKLAAYNKKIKDNLKSLVKKARKAIDNKDSKAREAMQSAFKAIDKAAQKGVIKKNTRDRKKSRLQALYNKSSKKEA